MSSFVCADLGGGERGKLEGFFCITKPFCRLLRYDFMILNSARAEKVVSIKGTHKFNQLIEKENIENARLLV